jgi:hypothetical protein
VVATLHVIALYLVLELNQFFYLQMVVFLEVAQTVRLFEDPLFGKRLLLLVLYFAVKSHQLRNPTRLLPRSLPKFTTVESYRTVLHSRLEFPVVGTHRHLLGPEADLIVGESFGVGGLVHGNSADLGPEGQLVELVIKNNSFLSWLPGILLSKLIMLMISALNRIFCALFVDFIDKILTLLGPDALRRVVHTALEKILLAYVLYGQLRLSTPQIDPGHILLQTHALNKPLIVLGGIARYFGLHPCGLIK